MSEKHYCGDIGEVEYIRLIPPKISSKTYYTKEYVEKLHQRISELEEQLRNAIVPKFEQHQQVFYISNGHIFGKWCYECESQDGIIINRYFLSKDKIVYHKKPKDLVFATKEEALKKLQELGD